MAKVSWHNEDGVLQTVDVDDLPTSGDPVEWADVFKPVRISPKALDSASRIVPVEVWFKYGLYTWLRQAAEHVFKHLPANKKEGVLGAKDGRPGLRFTFSYDHQGPVLESVKL